MEHENDVWDPEVQAFYEDFKWDETDISNGLETSNISIRYEGGISYEHIIVDLFTEKQTSSAPPQTPLEEKPFPRQSSLTKNDMNFFLSLDRRFNRAPHNKDSMFPKYKKILKQVLQEQEEFQSYLYHLAMETNRYNFVDPLVQTYIDARMDLAKERIKAHPQNYTFHSKIGISVVPFKTDVHPHKIRGHEIQLGKVPAIQVLDLVSCLLTISADSKHCYNVLFPKMHQRVFLERKGLLMGQQSTLPLGTALPMTITNNKMSESQQQRVASSELWRKCYVSCDPNAEKLAVDWGADIVLSMSSLYTFTDNQQPFPHEWEMPFIVKHLEDDDGNIRNVVFIDSPLPPKSYLPKDKNVVYYRKAVKLALGTFNHTLADIKCQVEQLKTKMKPPPAPPKTTHEADQEVEMKEEDIPASPKRKVVKKINKEVHSTSSDEFSISEDDSIPQLDGANDKLTPRVRRSKRKSSSKGKYKFKKKVKAETTKEEASTTLDESTATPQHTTASAESTASATPQTTNTLNESSDERMLSIDTESNQTSQQETSTVWPKMKSPKSMSSQQANTWKSSFISNKPKDIPTTCLDSSGFQPYKRKMSADKTATPHKSDSPPVLPAAPYQLSMKPSDISSLNFTASSFTSPTTRSPEKKTPNAGESFTMTPDIQLPIQKPKEVKNNRKPPKKVKSNRIFDDADESDDDTLTIATDDSDDENLQKTETLKPTKTTEKNKLKLNMWSPKQAEKSIKTPEKSPKVSEKSTKTLEKTQRDISTGTSAETLKNIKPFVPTTDLLGQILGIKTKENKTEPSMKTSTFWSQTADKMLKQEEMSKIKVEKKDGSLKDIERLNLLSPGGKCVVSYVLWQFGNKRVLIRYYVEGRAPPPNVVSSVPISIHTKLDYQLPLVYDQLSTSEVCRDWLALLIKDGSWLIRARVDPFKKQLVELEWVKDINKLLSTNQGTCIAPATQMKMVSTIFKNLSELGRGSYLCTHKTKDPFVEIRIAVEDTFKRVIYDLHTAYKNPGRTLESNIIPWLPGDPLTPCAYHREWQLVPLMFHPREEIKNIKSKKKKKKR